MSKISLFANKRFSQISKEDNFNNHFMNSTINYEDKSFRNSNTTNSDYEYKNVPKIDLLLTFNQNTKVDSLISNLMKQLNANFLIDKNSIILGKEKLYFSQVNPKTIYLSSQTSVHSIVKSNNPIKL